jgi:hypothetical protein
MVEKNNAQEDASKGIGHSNNPHADKSKYGGKPSINILAIENLEGDFLKYHIWFYNNPHVGGLTTTTMISDPEQVIQYIKDNQEYVTSNLNNSKRVNSEFIYSELEKIASQHGINPNLLSKTDDGRIKIKNHFYREDILDR